MSTPQNSYHALSSNRVTFETTSKFSYFYFLFSPLNLWTLFHKHFTPLTLMLSSHKSSLRKIYTLYLFLNRYCKEFSLFEVDRAAALANCVFYCCWNCWWWFFLLLFSFVVTFPCFDGWTRFSSRIYFPIILLITMSFTDDTEMERKKLSR